MINCVYPQSYIRQPLAWRPLQILPRFSSSYYSDMHIGLATSVCTQAQWGVHVCASNEANLHLGVSRSDTSEMTVAKQHDELMGWVHY